MRRIPWTRLTLALLTLCGMILSGCSNRPTEDAAPIPTSAKGAAITCFGVVRPRETCAIRFPFEVRILDVRAREGQVMSCGEPLLCVDMTKLEEQKRDLAFELTALGDEKRGYEAELAVLTSRLAVCRAGADGFDVNKVMEQIRTVAERKGGAAKYDEARAALMETLRRFDLLEYYDSLLAYAKAGDRFYYRKANPILMRIDRDFDVEWMTLKAQVEAKRAQIGRADADVLHAKAQLDDVLRYTHDGDDDIRLSDLGEITLARDGYLVDNILVSPGDVISAGEPVANLIRMDSLEVSCHVEEQLIRGIVPGSRVQLALYADNSVVELGSVAYVAQKAIEVNGETVVEVVIDYEGDGFLPGYNVVAKIASAE